MPILSPTNWIRAVLATDVVVSASLYFARFACCSSVSLEIVEMHLRTSLFDLYLLHVFRVLVLFAIYRDLDGFAMMLADPHAAPKWSFVATNVASLAAPFACAVWTVVRLLLMGSAFEDETAPAVQLTAESRSLTFAFLAVQLVYCVLEVALRRLVTASGKRWLVQNGPAANAAAAAAANDNDGDDKIEQLLSQLDKLIASARVSGQPVDKAAAQRLATAVQVEARATAAALPSDAAAELLAAARALVDATLKMESIADLSAKLNHVRSVAPKGGAGPLSSEDEGLKRAPRRRGESPAPNQSDDERITLLNK